MNRQEVVTAILEGHPSRPGGPVVAFASANIALCKYWGKRDEEINLPVTSSLSVSLGELGTETRLELAGSKDRFVLNEAAVDPGSSFAQRLTAFLDLFRPAPDAGFAVTTRNTMPTAAGLASSASGFAALVLALDRLMQWGLDARSLSMLARLGSGSACRSIHPGFVEWHAGASDDGMDSYGERLEAAWPGFCIAPLLVSKAAKPIGSRAAMRRTVKTSELYASWPLQCAADLVALRGAIRDRDFAALGRAAETNALAMHATMLAARPPVCYWLPESVKAMHDVWAARDDGVPVYFTMDAGPNVKLIFEAAAEAAVRERFPAAQVVRPFAAGVNTQDG